MRIYLNIMFFFYSVSVWALPDGFVYLQDVAPDIQQDMRYATSHNFLGRPVEGYQVPACILTREAAQQLIRVQQEAKSRGYSLKVYDCYRPKRAVQDFIQWSQNLNDQAMKAEFYPNIKKQMILRSGYVARYSTHSRGSTVDLTLVKLPVKPQARYQKGTQLVACYARYNRRFKDNSIDMGTGFDCFDTRAWSGSQAVSKQALRHRRLLQRIMSKHGFRPYKKEWWHFQLRGEPYPKTYFDFQIEA